MGSKFSRGNKNKDSRSSRGKRNTNTRDKIMNEYAVKVAQKHQEYAKIVREINRFQPNVKFYLRKKTVIFWGR